MAVDLFSGCGGLSRAFLNAGIQIAAAYENWEPAIACYKLNFDHPVRRMDLSDVDRASKDILPLRPDMIIGGPPCQDFSHAGKRSEGSRANLTVAFAEIVASVRPEWFVMENVDRARTSRSYGQARTILQQLYGLTETTLDASLCGVPQKRKRFICVGRLGESNGFLSKTIKSRLSQRPMTVRDYFGSTLGIEYYYRHPRNYSRRAIYSIDEPAATVRGVNRPVPKGYPGHPLDPVPVSAKLRQLTTLERSRLQTFSADYKWVGNQTTKEQMIGNAVPVKLGEYIAECILAYLRETGQEEEMTMDGETSRTFVEWLQGKHGLSAASAGDVVSRLRRAERIIGKGVDTVRSSIAALERSSEFDRLSVWVKPQLRRAIHLHEEFLAQR